MEDIKKDIEQIGKAVNEFKAIDSKLTAETEKLGHQNAELKAQLEKANEDISSLEEKVDAAYAAAQRTASGNAEAGENTLEQKHLKAFDHLIRTGEKGELLKVAEEAKKAFATGEIEQKDLSRIVAADGGFLVPGQMSDEIITKIFDTNPLLELASQQTISGAYLEILHDLDEAEASRIAERAPRSKTDTPQLESQKIYPGEMYAYPVATTQILEDASINMEQWLAQKVQDKMQRKLAREGLFGLEANDECGGILTYEALGAGEEAPVVNKIGETEFTGALVEIDDLLELCEDVKEEYLANAVWGMHRKTIKEIRKLKDSDGQYLWQPSLQAGVPSLFNGYPVRQFNDMAKSNGTTFQSGEFAAVFGDFRAGYQFVARRGMRVIRDEVTVPGKVKFHFSMRMGGAVKNFEAIRRLKKQ